MTGVRRAGSTLTLAAGLALVAGCGSGVNVAGIPAGGGANVLVAMAPTVAPSPTVFVMGLPTTERLAGGQEVKLLVGGPALSSPVAAQPVQLAPVLVETFTVTAQVLSGEPVTFTPADFVVRRPAAHDEIVTGPARVLVAPGRARTWKLTVTRTPGQGLLVWRDRGAAVASWSFVAEND